LPDPRQQNPLGTTFDNQLIELESVDSSNNYAMGLIHEGMASDGLICLARHQWAGKGQRGKTWLSEPGQNLTMSLVIIPSSLQISHQFLFSAAVALGILDQVRLFEVKNWTIKWPNDIFWNDRKAAGILIESIIQGNDWPWAVVGIGMNLNQESFPEEIPNAISLKQITATQYDPVELARSLLSTIKNRITILENDPDRIIHDYNQSLYKRNQSVALRKGNELLIATISAVDTDGILHTDNGSFHSGDIQFVVT
jgi:BirA family biotin operon repressor/biotin-[acetyl-CoA-carboxylase] ligase